MGFDSWMWGCFQGGGVVKLNATRTGVILGFIPRIHLSALSGVSGAMDPRDMPEDDNADIGSAPGSASRVSATASGVDANLRFFALQSTCAT